MSGVQAARGGDGMATTFTAPLPQGSDPAALPLIFASGAVYSNGRMRWGRQRQAAPPALG